EAAYEEALDGNRDTVTDSHQSHWRRAGHRPHQGGHGVVQPEGRTSHQSNTGSAEHEKSAGNTAIDRHAGRHEQGRNTGVTGTGSSAGPVYASARQQPIRGPHD